MPVRACGGFALSQSSLEKSSMSQPANDRLRELFLPAQGRKLAILSGEAVRDLFYLGDAFGVRRLVEALHRLGSTAGFDLILSFNSQGVTRFDTDFMQKRFDELARGKTSDRASEPPKQEFQPRQRNAASMGVTAQPSGGTTDSVARTEAVASSNLRTLLGQVDRVLRSPERVLAIFEHPEDLWFGTITEQAKDHLKQAASLALVSEGHPDSRVVFVVRPARREELLDVLDHIEETEHVREEIPLSAPNADEVRGFLDFAMNREGMLGAREHVVAEWTQRRWLLHNLSESVRSISQLPQEQRRIERVLERSAVEESAEDVLRELDQMVGLKSVKDQLAVLMRLAERQVAELREGRISEPITTHMLFLGNPGTGKTVVARLVARFLRASGLRSSGNVVEISRSDIASSYNSGDCIQRMRSAIDRATGGVLFVDEAYQFAEGDWMRGALETLMKDMEDRRATLTVIFAGYEEQMQELWNVNPGFRSRIPESNWIRFPDYSFEELSEVFRRECGRRQLTLTPEAEEAALRFIRAEQLRHRLGNGRGVRNLVDQIASSRAAHGGGPVTQTMVPEAARFTNDRVHQLLSALDKDFVGLGELKAYLRKTASRARQAEEFGMPIEGFLHCRFVGPPGTGKTTVARRVGEIFHAMGLLSHGRVREVNPVSHFGSQYVSQYAERVAEQFRLAKGGVLFIDEAYQLANDDQGNQIIHQIVQTLTQPTFADTLVIMAGYREPMNRLLERNPGLASRIPNEIVFESFSADELVVLFHRQLEKRDFLVRADDREAFDRALKPRISRERVDPHFANARSLQTLVDEILDHQRERIEATGDRQRMRVRVEDLGECQAPMEDIQRLMRELDDRFVGMTSVKDQLRDIAIDVQMQAELGGQSPKAPRMLFLGNPGTGKTSAARELARLLKATGAVVSDRWVETRGAELKGSYLGQTKDKVIEVIADARGGVLFIDEVYSLGNDRGGLDSYASEAIDAIVGQTELPANTQTAIILAGYLEPMRDFLGTNPGLARRFPTTILFPDYSDDECLEILKRWFVRTQSGQTLPIEMDGLCDTILSAIGQRRVRPHFGNAGDIEELGKCIVTARNKRVFPLLLELRRDQSRATIEDIERGVKQWLTAPVL